ncbi:MULTISPECIES: MFS transporter [Pseudomonas]|jgi:MFS family permease|uniref:MFS transporter n=1 Tax=Pseudomonas TaxID=286 RepID=UPI0005C68F38|nr:MULTISPECIES: MFS transporter [Pseudomonas]MBU0791654.1 MFS transporter [Gammaproteobacteria bacterium]MEB0191786.1 MFS transporter [Pseudomonas sp. CCI1.1]OEC56803.1 4-methylmuconolactone transporter [Pseudomonas sp. AP42]WPX50376.1 MFS transporter [Pseudomonas sp. CCI1.1]
MFSWYRSGTPREKKTFWACYAGWALDSYDMQMFSFLLPTLIGIWGLTKGEAGVIGTSALLSAALGGWIAGILSDRFGRVRILIFTVCWFTFFGVVAGFAQNFEQLLVARTLQGLGFGGEWAVGVALMAEVINPKNRGRALGFVQSGFALGWAGAVLIVTGILAYFPADYAWRLAFWVGVVPALVVIFIRRNVKDSEAFKQSQKLDTDKASIGTVFSAKYVKVSVLASLLVIGLQAGCYVILVWTPSLMAERGVVSGSLVRTILIMAFGSLCGFAATAYMSDRLGRRPTLIMLSLGSWIVTVAYMFVPLNPVIAHVMGFLVGALAIGMFAALGPFLSELFPTQVRTTCMGFSYNVGKSVGAMAVTGVGLLAAKYGLAQSVGAFCLGAYAIAVFALLLLPETKGVRLDDVVENEADVAPQPMLEPRT